MSEVSKPIYTAIAQRPTSQQLVDAANVLAQKAVNYTVIVTDADAAIVGELRARLNDQITKLDNDRLDMTSGARETVKKINDQFATVMAPLEENLKRIDALILDFAKRRKAEADKAEADRLALIRKEQDERAAANAETDPNKRVALIEQANQTTQQLAVVAPAAAPIKKIAGAYGSTTSIKENWTWRVGDITQVPERYLVKPEERVQRSMITAEVKARKGETNIPGIIVEDTGGVASRAGK